MNLSPRPPLLPLDAALGQLLVALTPLADIEAVSTMEADGRVLACEPIPGFLLAMVDAGGLLPQLKLRLEGKL